MRNNRENQLPLSPFWPDQQLPHELRVISKILDQNRSISDLVLQNLCDKVSPQNEARGLIAEQILRCAIIDQMHQFHTNTERRDTVDYLVGSFAW